MTGLHIVTGIVTNSTHAHDANQLNITSVPYPGISYELSLAYNVITLTFGGDATGDIVSGLLYTPNVTSASCTDKIAAQLPQDVTTLAQLPPNTGGNRLAIAPWLGADASACSVDYVNQAFHDHVNGLIFFIADNQTQFPPSPDSEFWYLPLEGGGDYSNAWLAESPFPVWAIPTGPGAQIVDASAQYSKNITQVPHANALVKLYGEQAWPRLYAQLNVTTNGQVLPSLWVFLLIILGVMLALMAAISLTMHYIQARRRNALRTRVLAGQVDLEALGIKRLTLPQDVLDDMPLYAYKPAPESASPPATATAKDLDTAASTTSSTSSSPNPAITPTTLSHPATTLLQPTCAICLEDFIPAAPPTTQGTQVRELPCRHIFHPECVDTFLKNTSSLCPLCKKSSLPPGYCPKKITNAMVRRERMVRLRGTQDADAVEAANRSPSSRSRAMAWGNAIAHGHLFQERRALRQSQAAASAPPAQGNPAATATEMQPPVSVAPIAPVEPVVLPTSQGNVETSPEAPQPPSDEGRREWARQRAEAMVGPTAPVDPDAEEARTMPRWRKAIMGVFPHR